MKRSALVLVMSGLWGACGGGDPSGSGGGAGGFGGGGASGFGGGGGGGGGATVTCGPSNCTGCCFNGACQPGSTAAGCGKSGAACVTCAASQACRVDQTAASIPS